jgi:hypothetical protein
MKPYKNIRTEELSKYPDNSDVHVAGRSTKYGDIKNKAAKAKSRRTFKHMDEVARDRQEYRDNKGK